MSREILYPNLPNVEQAAAEAKPWQFSKVEAENAREDDFLEVSVGGRSAVVFRRVKDGVRQPTYYVKGTHGGKTICRSTGFSVKSSALDAARKIWRAHLEGRLEVLESSKLRVVKSVATLGQVVKAYEDHVKEFSLRIDDVTIRKNTAALRAVVAWATGRFENKMHGTRRVVDQEAVERLSASELSAGLVERYLAAYVGAAGKDRVARESRIRGASSALRQARSVFSKSALRCYRDLLLPDLKGFMEAPVPVAKSPTLVGLSTEQVREKAKAALELKERDPALYMVHLLQRHLGLRNDEIEFARVGWLEERKEEVCLPNGERRTIAGAVVVKIRPDWEPKQSEGEVPIAPCVWEEIQGLIKGRKKEDFLVKAEHATARAHLVDRAHADFVRPWTESLGKRGYELRRWGATLVAARQGAEFADRFLRHKPKSVAGRFYVTSPVPPAPITLADCGVGSAEAVDKAEGQK